MLPVHETQSGGSGVGSNVCHSVHPQNLHNDAIHK